MKRINTIYYAHHMQKYNTEEEKEELESIKRIFGNSVIINPNVWINQTGDEKQIMGQCIHFVENCSDIVVFSSLDGVIGYGVYCELSSAFDNNVPVFYLKDDKISFFLKEDFENLNIIYGESGSRRFYAEIKNGEV